MIRRFSASDPIPASTKRLLTLTDSDDYQMMCGSDSGAYAIRVSRKRHPKWEMAVGDFIGFCEATQTPAALVLSEGELQTALRAYEGCRFDGPLRGYEPRVLLHSTPLENWAAISREGMLKSWNRLRREGALGEAQPIGTALGDPADFSDYVMFGSGATGEIVVSSRQQGRIVMDPNAAYHPGARLYFDAETIARDGLLLRDGCHFKVRDTLPLTPYLLFAATPDALGLSSPVSTPAAFSALADEAFARRFGFTP